MKIAVYSDKGNWVIDGISADFRHFSRHEIVNANYGSDVAWVLNPWIFQDVYAKMKAKKIYLQINHIETNKIKEYNFALFDKYVDKYIVPNHFTQDVLRKYIKKPIYLCPYWLLSTRMTPSNIDNVNKLRKKFGEDFILIGSFQKDSVYDTNRPKLCKGPDVFLSIVNNLNKKYKIKIILAGHNRRYLVEQLTLNKIAFEYLPDYKNINDLYDCLDWYFVTSRIEGGPQAILECAYRKVNILSTNVGMADTVLNPGCICNTENDFLKKINESIDYKDDNFSRVLNYTPEKIISRIDGFFESGLK